MPKYQQLSVEGTKLSLLLWGESGSGKTTIALSASAHPELAPVLVLNSDDGLASVAHLPNITFVDTNNESELLSVLEDLLKPEASRPSALRGIKTIIIDSLLVLRDQSLLEQADNRANKPGQKKDFSKDPFSNQIQDYQRAGNLIMRLLYQLRARGYHIIMTTTENIDTNTLPREAKPSFNPNLYRRVMGFCSMVWVTVEREGVYRMLVVPRGPDRYNVLYKVKTRNPRFAEALKQLTRQRAEEMGYDPEAAEGWIVRDDPDEPTLAQIYDLWLSVAANEQHEEK